MALQVLECLEEPKVATIGRSMSLSDQCKTILCSWNTQMIQLIQPPILNVIIQKGGLIHCSRLLQSCPNLTKEGIWSIKRLPSFICNTSDWKDMKNLSERSTEKVLHTITSALPVFYDQVELLNISVPLQMAYSWSLFCELINIKGWWSLWRMVSFPKI